MNLLQTLDLSKYHLLGEIPHELSNMSSLKTLDLSDNQLFGEIPEGIFGEHTRLNILLLKVNRFTGAIPKELCQLIDLSILHLSHHNFSEKANFTSKNRTNTYTGRILAYMSGVDLSSNKLLRNIPSELGNMRRIRSLNLSHDDLTGQIPTTFSNLVHGKSLNLSFNKLSGQIPPQLSVLSSLDVFIVAHNNLSGATPERKGQFSTFEESSYKGNQFLCGPPLPKSCNPLPLILPNDEGSDSLVDMFVFYVSFVVSYISALLVTAAALYINPYWRQAWVYYIELMNLNCYYFIMDNLLKLRR
ncbi:hypothetical protein GYH30_018385 [Glycine max]|uniref:Uncharacterized protein n=1 Tax=Glycine max TaxID=3847 RepID=A0A0R0JC79_SOYBN|nr:hypothetical protein GYH30_018385 [Glycine max]